MTNAKYIVSAFYGKEATFPKIEREEAISIWHTSLASAEIEVEAAKSRKDIDKVVFVDAIRCAAGGPGMTIWLRNDLNNWNSFSS